MSRKRRGLDPEEAALWHRVAKNTRPLHPHKKPETTTPEALVHPQPAKPRAPLPQFRIGEAAPNRAPGHVLRPGISDHLAGQPVRMDHKAFGRMTRGKLSPEAKLDLHGMTLAEAHPALTRFILRAYAEGLRLVLVVTGKGRDRDEGGPIPAPRGILKHQVPQWLTQPPLTSSVLQVAEAHRRHGGSGAYYVYLRRHPGTRSSDTAR